MDMNQNHLQTPMLKAMAAAQSKLQEQQVQEPKPLVNLKRAIFDACKVGEPFDSAEMIEALGKFGYRPASIQATLLTLFSEKKLSRSQKAPYAYSKLRTWDNESDAPIKVRQVRVKSINVDEMPRIPSIAAFRDNLNCMMTSAKPTTQFSMHDLELVMHQLTIMKITAQRYAFGHTSYHPDDRDLAIAYGELANDLQVLILGMEQTKTHLQQISRMAASLRSMS